MDIRVILAPPSETQPPVIYRILLNAWDEIMVAGVRVLVHDEQGKLVEAGDAVQQQKDWWVYRRRRLELRGSFAMQSEYSSPVLGEAGWGSWQSKNSEVFWKELLKQEVIP